MTDHIFRSVVTEEKVWETEKYATNLQQTFPCP